MAAWPDTSRDALLAAQLQEEERRSADRQKENATSAAIITAGPGTSLKSGSRHEREPSESQTSALRTSLSVLLADGPNVDIVALFRLFNQSLFWGRLDSVYVEWSPRMKLIAGSCSYHSAGGQCRIGLSQPLLQYRPVNDVVETLLHECIHAYLFVGTRNTDHSDHGPQFQSHMNRINRILGVRVTIYHSFHDEVDHYRTHVWQCNGPCRRLPPFYGISKRSMNRAPGPTDRWWSQHQATCGGTFIKIKEPAEATAKAEKKRLREEKKQEHDKKKLNEAKQKQMLEAFVGKTTPPTSASPPASHGKRIRGSTPTIALANTGKQWLNVTPTSKVSSTVAAAATATTTATATASSSPLATVGAGAGADDDDDVIDLTENMTSYYSSSKPHSRLSPPPTKRARHTNSHSHSSALTRADPSQPFDQRQAAASIFQITSTASGNSAAATSHQVMHAPIDIGSGSPSPLPSSSLPTTEIHLGSTPVSGLRSTGQSARKHPTSSSSTQKPASTLKASSSSAPSSVSSTSSSSSARIPQSKGYLLGGSIIAIHEADKGNSDSTSDAAAASSSNAIRRDRVAEMRLSAERLARKIEEERKKIEQAKANASATPSTNLHTTSTLPQTITDSSSSLAPSVLLASPSAPTATARPLPFSTSPSSTAHSLGNLATTSAAGYEDDDDTDVTAAGHAVMSPTDIAAAEREEEEQFQQEMDEKYRISSCNNRR